MQPKYRHLLLILLILTSPLALAQLKGNLTKADVDLHLNKIESSGVDLSKPYTWELRFTGKFLPDLEAFTQTAHQFGYWPVVLESDPDGSKYWLYIQTSRIYNKETFYTDFDKLIGLAENYRLESFDGFSVSAAIPSHNKDKQ